MKKILVLLGGGSPERAISLRSGAAVCAALTEAGYEVDELDAIVPDDQILEHARQADMVFPVLHGLGGEDGTIQALLETEHIPFIGSGSEASIDCFDKWRYKQILIRCSIPTPQGALVNKSSFRQNSLVTKPFVLKPHDGGSSIDTYIIREVNESQLLACEQAFERHKTMLIEELIVGTEITVGVLNDQSLPVIEIIPPSGKEFDLENKYNGATQELCPPIHVPEAVQKKSQQLAYIVHQELGCSQISRTDMIIDAHGNLHVLETNTIPGMTSQSLFPKAALQSRLTMPQLMSALVSSTSAK